MKKKILFVSVVTLISIGLLFLFNNIQKKLYSNESNISNKSVISKTEDNKKEDVNKEVKKGIKEEKPSKSTSPEASKGDNNKNIISSKKITLKEETKKEETKTQAPAKEVSKNEPNVIIKSSIDNKVILSKYEDIDGKTVGEVTIDLLSNNGIKYSASGDGATLYIKSIDELKERAKGMPLSGWCFYVNGEKGTVGAGVYKLKKGDKLLWIYQKDGLSS